MTRSRRRPSKAVQTTADSTLRREERKSAGKALRQRAPHESHGSWSPAATRRDPVEQVIEANQGRSADLVPIRDGRVRADPDE